MNDIVDKQLEAEFKKYNVTNEKDLERACHIETIKKYQALKLSPAKEARLRKEYRQDNKKTTMQHLQKGNYFDFVLRDPSMTKPKIARHVFITSLECPEYSITEMCSQAGLSQGYFRELRLIHKKEWLDEHLTREEDGFIFQVVCANDSNFSNEEWIDWFGKDEDRSRWMV